MVDLLLLEQLSSFIGEFARAGGGGSGGGGGGFHGSGGGGGLALIMALGFIPLYFIGRAFRKGQRNESLWPILKVLGWAIVAVCAGVAISVGITLFRADTRTGMFVPIFLGFMFPLIAGMVLGMGAGLYAWFGALRQSDQVRKALKLAASKDAQWNEKKLVKYAKGIFLAYQKDWSRFNTESMKQYMTPHYLNHAKLMLHGMSDLDRVNRVTAVDINSVMITAIHDAENNNEDTFTVGITARANDRLIDTKRKEELTQTSEMFTEFWTFKRRGNNWLLDGIGQATNREYKVDKKIEAFAEKNGLYYSPDWGRLLIPAHGYLFDGNALDEADINNHAIGFVNDLLTQVYTYSTSGGSRSSDDYLVVQTALPKSYGRILVKRKKSFFSWSVDDLRKISMEWNEFNDRYDVYASKEEQVTTFELLHPAFMAKLHDLPFEVSIEVVDNIVYLFAPSHTDVQHYEMLFELLKKAHKEMRL